MFSQYSWWDFIKFVLALAVPYYAFVLFKYYREDIREWISNRGQSTPAAETSQDEEEEPDDTGLFTVKTYSDPAPTPQAKAIVQPRAPLPREEVVHEKPDTNTIPEDHDVDLSDGVIIPEESNNTFGVALVTEVVRPAERSLSDVINAARRVTADGRGALSANDPNDADAAEVATLINKQKGLDSASLLSGVSFNR